MQRNVSEAKKKNVAGKQFFKCANNPGSNIHRLENYDCPLWKKIGDIRGSFDESGYDIDHIIEHCITNDDSVTNLQALCKSCHSVKTKRFLMKDDTIRISKKCIKCNIIEVDGYKLCKNCYDINIIEKICTNCSVNKSNTNYKWCDICYKIKKEKCAKCNINNHSDGYKWCKECYNGYKISELADKKDIEEIKLSADNINEICDPVNISGITGFLKKIENDKKENYNNVSTSTRFLNNGTKILSNDAKNDQIVTEKNIKYKKKNYILNITDWNELKVKELKYLADILDIDYLCKDKKETLIGKISERTLFDEIIEFIGKSHRKKYYVKFLLDIGKICHQKHTNKNYSKNKKCQKCNNKIKHVVIYDNIFYKHPKIKFC